MSTTSSPQKVWTYPDYLGLDDDNRYEIIHGHLIQEPAPGLSHQSTIANLHILLSLHVRKHRLGEIFLSPVDVILDRHNTVQPDLAFVCNGRLDLARERGLFGPPDLAVEIISPGSFRRDRVSKMALYQEFGVREYWIVDPSHRSIEVYALTAAGYELRSDAEGSGFVESGVVEGLRISVAEAFEGIANNR